TAASRRPAGSAILDLPATPAPHASETAETEETLPVADDDVLVARDGPVFTLTFNRPEARNALTWAMYDRLTRACEEVDADDAIRVFVLRGAGGKAFVAGTDIGQFTAFDSAEAGLAYERDGDRRIERLERVRKPVIAQ